MGGGMVSLVYQISFKTMSVKWGVYAYEAPEVK
jgi:hypothetical protein